MRQGYAVRIRACACVVLAGFLLLGMTQHQEVRSPPPLTLALSDGILAWYLNQAKAKHKSSIEIPIGIPLVAEPEALDVVLKHTTVVLAAPVAQVTTHDKDGIYTWKKYRVLEKLSTQPYVPSGAFPDEVPQSLLPLQAGEFLMPEPGGVIELDGVKITQRDPQRHTFSAGRRELMYTMFKCSGMCAALNYGPTGHFEIDDSDVIDDAGYPDQPMYKELMDRTGGKLAKLREIAAESSRNVQ